MPRLRLCKISLTGGLIYQEDFDDLEAIAKHLNISVKLVTLIYQKHKFPKGKHHVLNKYSIFTAPVVDNRFVVTFD